MGVGCDQLPWTCGASQARSKILSITPSAIVAPGLLDLIASVRFLVKGSYSEHVAAVANVDLAAALYLVSRI